MDPGSKNYFWGQKNLCNTLLALALGSGHVPTADQSQRAVNPNLQQTEFYALLPLCSSHLQRRPFSNLKMDFFFFTKVWYCNKIRKRSNDGEWITAKYKLSKKGEGKKQNPPFLQPIVSQQSCLSDFV